MAAQFRHDARCGGREYHAVEQAVDDVAECTCRNQRQPHQNAGRSRPFADQAGDPPAQYGTQADAEERKQQFPDSPAELHAESHALVLDEEDLEPVPQDIEMLSDRHVGLDQDLDDLVNDHQQDSENKQLLPFRDLHAVYRLPCFSRMALPSTVVVACGTRRSRSFGISFPVTRQTP